eukprot:gene11813-5891_t
MEPQEVERVSGWMDAFQLPGSLHQALTAHNLAAMPQLGIHAARSHAAR